MPKISPITAGEILGISAQTVRIFVQREKLPIGTALFRGQWTYDIRTAHVAEYLRLPVERVNEAVELIKHCRKLKNAGEITHEEYKDYLVDIREAMERKDDAAILDLPELQSAS